ncbi:autotransporter strand-loop-strand O-heptosyltransferase [Paraburkholderia aromaticivorans]|uniref:Autotransporter strand-loop-strand O-heptosyltransferase n=1 Tax=Paraburkholderia aromaticivorans TaxID=2026199 RepID=A0A248VVN4_9BURK|nr:autotransporter strand-loop-strand O-heptosyltransferase [Paraburkholderia aromaticivorans]ASW03096.1 autotransporter strand-loop-strand O-heptosyltransferase [Paraburkholderia aromaticivorans]
MIRDLANVDASSPGSSISAATTVANATGPDASESGVLAVGDAAEPRKATFRAAAPLPTQAAPLGVRFDFNDGCRIVLPKASKTTWHVRLADFSTGNVLFETTLETGAVASSKKYFVPFSIEIEANGTRVFEHRFDATDKPVLIEFPVGTLGDIIGWFPYAMKFQRQHGCKLTCSMGPLLIPLFRDCYPDIEFVTPEEVRPEHYYASYRIGLYFDDETNVHQPTDFQLVGLHRTAGYILGVDPVEEPPQISLPDGERRPVAEKYVCVAVQSSTQCKYWNHPPGWRELVAFLKEHGYRVICIDQKATHGSGMVWNHIPHGAEDHTGDRPLTERARWLRHAEFFVGLSSGLSWLAWAVGTPVVMISGFTHPTNEFATPYRVINFHTCNSCWNDVRVRFDHKDFLWCPRHAGTPRQFECTRLITTEQVKQAIRRIPAFAAQAAGGADH